MVRTPLALTDAIHLQPKSMSLCLLRHVQPKSKNCFFSSPSPAASFRSHPLIMSSSRLPTAPHTSRGNTPTTASSRRRSSWRCYPHRRPPPLHHRRELAGGRTRPCRTAGRSTAPLPRGGGIGRRVWGAGSGRGAGGGGLFCGSYFIVVCQYWGLEGWGGVGMSVCLSGWFMKRRGLREKKGNRKGAEWVRGALSGAFEREGSW